MAKVGSQEMKSSAGCTDELVVAKAEPHSICRAVRQDIRDEDRRDNVALDVRPGLCVTRVCDAISYAFVPNVLRGSRVVSRSSAPTLAPAFDGPPPATCPNVRPIVTLYDMCAYDGGRFCSRIPECAVVAVCRNGPAVPVVE